MSPGVEEGGDLVVSDAQLVTAHKFPLQEHVRVLLQLVLEGRAHLFGVFAKRHETQSRVHRLGGVLLEAAEDKIVTCPVDVRLLVRRIKLRLVGAGIIPQDRGGLSECEVAILHRGHRMERVQREKLLLHRCLAWHRRHELGDLQVHAEEQRPEAIQGGRHSVELRLACVRGLPLQQVDGLHLLRRGHGDRPGGLRKLFV
mmetsp:Transcript_12391/g.35443  ORF Transcript_12391/g.35443 Transcript_12391/m.35443 type:complete len:200 (-) Transcript_12391:59-658(-)